MNPNYLLKNEVEYELRIREITLAGDANLLRKQLRQAISLKLSSSVARKVLTGDVQEDFSICVKKLRRFGTLLYCFRPVLCSCCHTYKASLFTSTNTFLKLVDVDYLSGVSRFRKGNSGSYFQVIRITHCGGRISWGFWKCRHVF